MIANPINQLNGARHGSLVRCAIYTRVSTDDQARGEYNSLETQRDICQHAIAVHQPEGWVATHFIDDPGFSGKNLERPGMQSLLREVRSGNVDVVVAYKLDRITRCLPDFYEFWKVLEQHKVNFVSATQSFDTNTPMGMLMLNMLTPATTSARTADIPLAPFGTSPSVQWTISSCKSSANSDAIPTSSATPSPPPTKKNTNHSAR